MGEFFWGRLGGYNGFYADMFSYHRSMERSGRRLSMARRWKATASVPGAMRKMGDIYASFIHENTGTATWLEKEGAGPFDGPETLAPSERCLISFASTVPTLPSLYNNYKRIVQTDDHIMILQEMVHDARVIRIDSEHSSLLIRNGWEIRLHIGRDS